MTMTRNAKGMSCHELDPEAIEWCTYGAIYAAYINNPGKREQVLDKLYSKLLATGYTQGVGVWNDDPRRTQSEVIGLLESIGE